MKFKFFISILIKFVALQTKIEMNRCIRRACSYSTVISTLVRPQSLTTPTEQTSPPPTSTPSSTNPNTPTVPTTSTVPIIPNAPLQSLHVFQHSSTPLSFFQSLKRLIPFFSSFMVIVSV